MLILILFAGIPGLAGFLVEYLVCRFTMKQSCLWKGLPPLIVAALTTLVAVGRYRVWISPSSPIPTLIFMPGLPALFGFFGLLAGWLLWRRRWLPKVVKARPK